MLISYKEICKSIVSEEEFIENSLLGIGVIQDGKIIYANNTILKYFGYNFDEVQEKNFWMNVIHPDDLPIVKKRIEFKLKEKKYDTTRYKCRIFIKSGESKQIEVFSKIFYYNDRLATLFTIIEIPEQTPLVEFSIIDIAKVNIIEVLLERFNIPYRVLKSEDFQKSLEEELLKKKIALKDAKSKFQHLFETSPFSIMFLDFKGRILECNITTEKLFNCKKEELIGEKFLDILNFPPNHRSIIEDVHNKLMKGEELLPIQTPCFTKEGRTISIKLFFTLIRLNNEIIIQVIILDRDPINTFKF